MTAPAVSGTLAETDVEGCSTADAPAPYADVAALENAGMTISDACTSDANLTVNVSAAINGTCPIVMTRTYTVEDECGNVSASFTHIINIDDNTAPAVSGTIADTDVEGCSADAAPAAFSTVDELENAGMTISDACTSDANLTVNVSAATNGTCPIVMTRTYTVTDQCGNESASFTHTINIDDTTPPNITTGATNLVVDCDGNGNMTELMNWLDTQGGAQATDNCNFTWSNNFNMSINGACATGDNMVTFTATDDCGNISTTQATFTIVDNDAPTVSGNLIEMNIEGCTAAEAPIAYITVAELENAGVTITDACSDDNNITVQLNESSDGTCPIVITRRYTVTDACGNVSDQFSQTINIDDNTPPSIDIGASNLTVECDGNGNTAELNAWIAANGNAAASDICSNVTWSVSSNIVAPGLNAATFANTVTFTATDDCGNTSSTTAIFTIIDTTPPSIDTDASNSTVECDGAGNTAQLDAWLNSNGGAAASDICGNLTWSNNFSSLSDDCGNTGTATVTFIATDEYGNSSSTTATFTIEDTAPPTIGTDASNSTVECDGAGNMAQLNAWLASNGGAAASDVCSNVTWSNNYTSLSDGCGETGTATVTFTATDDCGNSSSTTATFTIEDTAPPTIGTDASHSTVECDGAGNMAQLNAWLASNGGAAASDVCSNVTWSNNFAGLSDGCGETGAATVTFTATDDCGNSSSTTA
ncbi:MAG: hypothetical protein MI974_19820, partial [Chitinophagales bacterium]|nr:hypothetical protein [Chitinophagales bacterium]